MKHKIGITSLIAVTLTTSIALPSLAGNFERNHGRRAQVLRRDNYEQVRLNRNKGNLGGHYGQLTHEDKNIRRQEQNFARNHHGHITGREQARLNREETRLNNQINRDRR